MQGRAWVPDLVEGEEVFYAVLPLFHAYGMTLCLTFAMSIGAKLVLFPKFDLDLVKDAARKSPPTFLPGVPPIYDQLARAASHGTIDLSTVRFAISGAMSLRGRDGEPLGGGDGRSSRRGLRDDRDLARGAREPDGPDAPTRNGRGALPQHRDPRRRS